MASLKLIIAALVGVSILTIGGIAGAMMLVGGPADEPADADASQDGGASTAAPTGTATAAATASNGTATNETANGTAVGTATPTAAPTPAATPPGTATATAVPTERPPEQRTPILSRQFDEREIELELRRLVNEWRVERGLPRYGLPNGTITERLDRMADAYSQAMANSGSLSYEINGTDTVDRYEEFDLLTTCGFQHAEDPYVVSPKNYPFELSGTTYAGRAYESDNGTQFHDNETAVARALFDEWTENEILRKPLTFEAANRFGVGVVVTETNEVYAAGNICGSGS